MDTVILYLPDCSAPATVAAADQAVELLSDARLRQKTVEHSFQVGQQHYSLEALQGYLARLMED